MGLGMWWGRGSLRERTKACVEVRGVAWLLLGIRGFLFSRLFLFSSYCFVRVILLKKGVLGGSCVCGVCLYLPR